MPLLRPIPIRPQPGWRALVAGTSGLLALGAGGFFALHGPAAQAEPAVNVSANGPDVADPPEAGATAPDTDAIQSGRGTQAGGPDTEKAAPEADGPGGWADPAGSAGAHDQTGEH